MPLVIFDLDNTLVDRDVAFRHWADSLIAERDLQASERDWLIAADQDGFRPRSDFLAAVRQRYGLDEPMESLRNRYDRAIVAGIVLADPVRAMLDQLRAAGWTVALATNGTSHQQRAKLERTDLTRHLDGVAISAEVGADKPDRAMFAAAAAAAGADLAPTGWMVGDCPMRDIGGGYAAGLRTIWIRRNRQWDATLLPPDEVVDDVTAVVDVLSGQSQP